MGRHLDYKNRTAASSRLGFASDSPRLFPNEEELFRRLSRRRILQVSLPYPIAFPSSEPPPQELPLRLRISSNPRPLRTKRHDQFGRFSTRNNQPRSLPRTGSIQRHGHDQHWRRRDEWDARRYARGLRTTEYDGWNGDVVRRWSEDVLKRMSSAIEESGGFKER